MVGELTQWVVEGKRWVVDGEQHSDGHWESFEDTYSAASKSEARWMARRAQAPGDELAELEAQPPGAARERVEIEAPSYAEALKRLENGEPVPFASDRDKPRTDAEAKEYARLTEYVRITAVTSCGS